MKISCPFCKVEYSASVAGGRRVRCAVCGHVFIPVIKKSTNFLMWATSIIMVLAAAIFVFAIAIKYLGPVGQAAPLVIENIVAEPDHRNWIISGQIRNASAQIQGVPEIVIHIKDASANILHSTRFTPPAPIMHTGEFLNFRFTLTQIPPGKSQISVEFAR